MTADDRSPTDRVPADQDHRSMLGLVPRRLLRWAAWTVLLAVIGAGIWLGYRVVAQLAVITVPIMAALLFAALLLPLDRALRRVRLPRPLAAVFSVLVLLLVVGGVGLLVEISIATRFDRLVSDFSQSLGDLRSQLIGLPFIEQQTFQQLQDRLSEATQSSGGGMADTALSVTKATVNTVAGTVLCLFLTVFLLYDGDRIWAWFRDLFPTRTAVASPMPARRRGSPSPASSKAPSSSPASTQQ